MPDLINEITAANFIIAWVAAGVSIPALIACAIIDYRRTK